MSQPPTKSGTPKLSDLARHVILPTGITSTGWPSVRNKCLELGVRFDTWQDGLGRAILAKRADGKYAAGVGGVVVSIPRQVGKTYTVGAIVFALCILFPGLTVVWTAHRLKTAGETFRSMQGMARRRKIAPYVEQVFTGSGDEEVRFRNGSRILFGARERGFGRGFAEVDIEVFDEAQILTERALDDMIPATNQSKQAAGALLFFIGTPPKPTDPGEAFTAKRTKALAGNTTDMLFVEFSADEGADPDDRKQWAKANASYPHRTPAEAMLRMQENLTAESFLREGLGIWDKAGGDGILPDWNECAIPPGDVPNVTTIGVAASVDQSHGSIAAAGTHADGRIHIGAVDRRRGTAWMLAEVKRIQTVHDCAVVIDEKGPAADLIEPLESAGVRVTRAKLNDYLDACAAVFRGVQEHTITHAHTDDLDTAVSGATWRTVGDRRAFARKTSDVAMLEAATLAAWGAGPAKRSKYENDEMTVV